MIRKISNKVPTLAKLMAFSLAATVVIPSTGLAGTLQVTVEQLQQAHQLGHDGKTFRLPDGKIIYVRHEGYQSPPMFDFIASHNTFGASTITGVGNTAIIDFANSDENSFRLCDGGHWTLYINVLPEPTDSLRLTVQQLHQLYYSDHLTQFRLPDGRRLSISPQYGHYLQLPSHMLEADVIEGYSYGNNTHFIFRYDSEIFFIDVVRDLGLATTETQSIEPTPSLVRAIPVEREEESRILSEKIIIQEPNTPHARATRRTYGSFDSKQKLHFGMELITEENVDKWKQRMAYESYMHFAKQNKREKSFIEMMQPEEISRILEEKQKACEASGDRFSADLTPPSVHESEEFFRDMIKTIEENRNFMVLFTQKAPEFSERNNDYLGAWRGFIYNLKHYTEAQTWVAYVTTGGCGDDIDSPNLLMAMTVRVSENFYTPLGIYRSPIAVAAEQGAGIKNLSMMLHGYVAHTMTEINPHARYMIVRPLDSMLKIFQSSGLIFSRSTRYEQDTPLPYVRCGCDLRLAREMGFTKLAEEDGGATLVLAHQKANTIIRIGEGHWFSYSPFLGGADFGLLKAFPFITMEREELAKCRTTD